MRIYAVGARTRSFPKRVLKNKMQATIISANLGGIDKEKKHVEQIIPEGWNLEFKMFDSSNTPLRKNAMMPRLQAKVYRMCGADYAPGADMIIWLDAAYRIISPDFVSWMIRRLGDASICLMPHPSRVCIDSELKYCTYKTPKGDKYEFEPMIAQVQSYLSDKTFKDNWLAATGCFIYRPTPIVKAALTDWLLECVKWTVQDQLSLSYVFHKHDIVPSWLDHTVWNNPYLEYNAHVKKI